MNYKGLSLVTSNEDKLREYHSYGLHGIRMEKGIDLREVAADPFTVTLYKSLEAGDGRIVEDTSLDVENANIGTEVKFRLNELDRYIKRKAQFRVMLGVNFMGTITVFEGVVIGYITPPKPVTKGTKVFGFDNYFTPAGSPDNLYQLQLQGKKHLYSPRSVAIANLLRGNFVRIVPISTIPPWTGKYQ